MFYFDEESSNKSCIGNLSDDEFVESGNFSPHDEDECRARQQYGGRDTDHFFGSFEGEDSGDEAEAEEEPGELVPLGLPGANRVKKVPRQRRASHRSTTFYDFYKLTDDHLGSGAYGSVATCVSITTGKEFAAKIVSKSDESHTRSRIVREVKLFEICRNHPNIVQLVEWFEDDENYYMVFEKMRGGPLLQHILKKGYFTEEEARLVTKDIAVALKFLHDRGIAHRDVKPENVLCTERDRISPVKLCDLDLASRPVRMRETLQKLNQVASEPDLASPVGSAEFMAPEVVDTFVGDRLKYDKRCDMWSLGVIIYIMLCGYAPFQGECDDDDCGWMEGQACEDCQNSLFCRIQEGIFDFPDEEWSMISQEAKDLVRHLLVKDVKKRFTADEVLHHPWIKCSAPQTSLQTANNLFRNDSARDVQQMTEHFNVMNRLGLSTQFENRSLSDENSPQDSESHASPTHPPPLENEELQQNYNASIPLFMIPPKEFWDPITGQMIYPPASLCTPPLSKPASSSFENTKPRPKVYHFSESTLTFEAKPIPRREDFETCQTAMVKEDSKSDLHQVSRETEVNV